MTDDWRLGQMRRADALVAAEWCHVDLVRDEAQPPPGEIGALDGFGLRGGANGAVRAGVYLFGEWGGGRAAGELLQEMVDGDGYRAVAASNGALLLFAVAPADDPAALADLDRLVGAFHGIE